MVTAPPVRFTVRPAEVVNAEIRALWTSGPLRREDRAQYLALLMEWAEASRAEQRRAGQIVPEMGE